MDKIFDMLDLDKLDESKQTEIQEAIQQKMDDICDVKLHEQKEDLREQLVEEYETKFDDYKNDISEKFSNFVDGVLDEEMVISENIKEFARKGELYEDVMETLKSRMAIDEGMIKEETKEILSECHDKIEDLKSDSDTLISENMELKTKMKHMETFIYLTEECEGLTAKQKEKAFSLLEGVQDKDEIRRKIDVIIESTDDKVEDVKPILTESKPVEEISIPDDQQGSMVSYWNNMISST